MAMQSSRTNNNERWHQRRTCTAGNAQLARTIEGGDYYAWKSRIQQLANLVDLIDYDGPHSQTLRQQFAAVLLEAFTGPTAAVLRRQLIQTIVEVLQAPAAADLRRDVAKALTDLLAEDMVEIVRGVLDALGIKKPRQRHKASKPSEGKEALYGHE